MAMKKKFTHEDLTETLESVGEAAAGAAQAVSEMAAEAVKKAEPAMKAAVEKAEPTMKAAKRAVKTAAKKAEPTVKAATRAAKETGKRMAQALSPEICLQWGGRDVDCGELVERAKQDYKAANKGVIHSCKLYIKPEDGMVYYVINDQSGKISL